MLLEHRLCLELHQIRLVEHIFPIVLGDDVDESGPVQKKVQWGAGGWIPDCPDVCVRQVEQGTCHHLSTQALGTPLHPDHTVLSVMTQMKKMQGALIDGLYDEKMRGAEERIFALAQMSSSSLSKAASASVASPTPDLENENRSPS